MLKAYKYRIYPNNEQKIQIAKTFGCCRFVYNQTLAYRKEVYEKEKKSVSKADCNNYCNRQLKKEYEWLKEVDKFALTNAIYNMDAAYQKFFKEHTGYPKFKSKHDNHKSYTTNFTNGNITVDFGCNRVKLPKLKGVKAKLHRNFIGQIKSATISQVPSGKYYVSILVETEHVELPHINQNTGIDLGIKELCITSAGKKYENPKIIRKYEKKLVKLQRQLAHKEKRSQNYCKTKKKIALCHEKITNTRKDYLHKMSHEIISENQVIVSEDLQIKNMVKNHRLAKSISDRDIFDKVAAYIKPEDFIDPLFSGVAEKVYEQYGTGNISPAAIIADYATTEEHTEVAAMFSADLDESLNNLEREKTLNDIVIRIKANSLNHELNKTVDPKRMQEIIIEQQKLNQIHIKL